MMNRSTTGQASEDSRPWLARSIAASVVETSAEDSQEGALAEEVLEEAVPVDVSDLLFKEMYIPI